MLILELQVTPGILLTQSVMLSSLSIHNPQPVRWQMWHLAGCRLHPSGHVLKCFAALIGVVAAVRGAAAPEWEVRNAANLCFAALVSRIVGYNNVRKVRTLLTTFCCRLPSSKACSALNGLPAFSGSSRCALEVETA